MRGLIIFSQVALILIKVLGVYEMPWWVVLLPLLIYILFAAIDYVFYKLKPINK